MMTTVDYNRIDFTFSLDDQGEHSAIFSLYRKEIEGLEQKNILNDDADFLGMIINLSGQLHHYRIGDTANVLPKGHYNFFYIPKGTGSWTLEPGMNSIAFIQCDFSFLPQFAREIPLLNDFLKAVSQQIPATLTDTHLPLPSEILDSVLAIMRDQSFTQRITRDMFIRIKLSNIFLVGLTNCQEKSKKFVDEREYAQLHRLYQYILDNVQYIKDTRVLAEQVKMSERQVRKKFKQAFSMSINQVLLYAREKKSEELLLTTSIPVNEVGQRVGYRNQSAFSKAFYKRHGISPSEYRLKATLGSGKAT